jgi:hypothetical protein
MGIGFIYLFFMVGSGGRDLGESNTNTSANPKEEIMAAFPNFDFDRSRTLLDFCSKTNVEKWLARSLPDIAPPCQGSFSWISLRPVGGKWKFSFNQLNEKLRLNQEALVRRISNGELNPMVLQRTGEISIETDLNSITPDYNTSSDEVAFHATYTMKFSLSIDQTDNSDFVPEQTSGTVASTSYHRTFEICRVPLTVIRCWMMDKLEDPLSGVGRPEVPNDRFIFYGSCHCPIWLVRLIRKKLGFRTFAVFQKAGFLSQEAFEVISARLNELERNTPFEEVDEPFSEPEQEVMDPPSPAADIIEAVETSAPDREFLAKVNHLLQTRPDLDWSYSDWAKGTGAKKSTAYGRLKSLQQRGLVLITELSGGGEKIIITPKGRRVLSAFD